MFWRAAVMLYCIPAIVEEHSVRCTWTLLMPVKMYSGTALSSSAMVGKFFWNIVEFLHEIKARVLCATIAIQD